MTKENGEKLNAHRHTQRTGTQLRRDLKLRRESPLDPAEIQDPEQRTALERALDRSTSWGLRAQQTSDKALAGLFSTHYRSGRS